MNGGGNMLTGSLPSTWSSLTQVRQATVACALLIVHEMALLALPLVSLQQHDGSTSIVACDMRHAWHFMGWTRIQSMKIIAVADKILEYD